MSCRPRESELVELTRDYSTMQAAYTNLLVKREDAMLAANLERRQIGEQFKLLDTASMPERPYNQTQRLGIMSCRRDRGPDPWASGRSDLASIATRVSEPRRKRCECCRCRCSG